LPFAYPNAKIKPPKPRTTTMARPLRIEFPGATYHVTSRGDRREPIYRDDADRLAQLQVIGAAMDRFGAKVLAYPLGDVQFVARMQALASAAQTRAPDILRAQQLPALSLLQCLERCGGDRARALRMAHVEGGLSMSALARAIGLSVSRVSRIIAGEAAVTGLKRKRMLWAYPANMRHWSQGLGTQRSCGDN
jgi:hypothetical protein